MKNVTVDEIEPGMIVAKDVCDRGGRMLLGAGAELTEKHLVVFRTWGVSEVSVEGDGDDYAKPSHSASEIPKEIFDKVAGELEPLFAASNRDHQAIAELFRLAVIRNCSNATF